MIDLCDWLASRGRCVHDTGGALQVKVGEPGLRADVSKRPALSTVEADWALDAASDPARHAFVSKTD
jgi:hypothetical protein